MRSIVGEDPVAAGKSRQGAEQVYSQRRQRHFMNAPDLVPGGWDREHGVVTVEARKLRPTGFRPIVAALRRSKQDLNEDAKRPGIRRRVSHCPDFIFGENPLPPHHAAGQTHGLVA